MWSYGNKCLFWARVNETSKEGCGRRWLNLNYIVRAGKYRTPRMHQGTHACKGASGCLIYPLCDVLIIKMHYYFFFPNTMGIPSSPPPSWKHSPSGPGEIQMHKAPPMRARCSALNHVPSQGQPLCIIRPWLIEWVCADWGSWEAHLGSCHLGSVSYYL